MIFSRKCEYALRALVHLARSNQVCDSREISRAQQAPYHFIAKVLQELKAKGFVKSVRGVGGGFQLTAVPETVRLRDLICALDGDQIFKGCVYGFMGCKENEPCPLHDGWAEIRSRIEIYLRTHTLADLARNGDTKPPGRTEEFFSGSELERFNK